MFDLTIIKQDGGLYIDSRQVAEAIGKRHDKLLRDITEYMEVLEKFAGHNLHNCNFFMESSYHDDNERLRLRYLISKQGCEMIAHRLAGKRMVLFTAAYVAAFDKAEAAEREAQAKPRLGEFNSAVRNVLNGMAKAFAAPKHIMGFLQSVYKPLGIEVPTVNEADYYNYFTATEIAAELGIYSDTGKPHGHAVSAIISKLENHENHAIAIPYGLVGVSMRYDKHITEAVRNWITNNGFPYSVSHQNFRYHIRYDRQPTLFEACGYDDLDNPFYE